MAHIEALRDRGQRLPAALLRSAPARYAEPRT